MISIHKNFLFIHVPKTGGNSIQSQLIDYSDDELVGKGTRDGIDRFDIVNKNYSTRKHAKLKRYKRTLPNQLYNKLFKFSVIRNPYERLISFYFSPHRGKQEWNREAFIALIYRVQQLQKFIRLPDKISSNSHSTDLCRDIDYLICFERLQEDLATVCETLQIRPFELPQRNKSDRQHYSHYYDKELQELVATRFKEEITYGGYEFNG